MYSDQLQLRIGLITRRWNDPCNDGGTNKMYYNSTSIVMTRVISNFRFWMVLLPQITRWVFTMPGEEPIKISTSATKPCWDTNSVIRMVSTARASGLR